MRIYHIKKYNAIQKGDSRFDRPLVYVVELRGIEPLTS